MNTTTELTLFQFEGRQVRTSLNESGEPLVVAKDVCDVLSISKYRDAIAGIPEWAQGCPVRVDTLGGAQDMGTLREAGVYWLILRSNKPEAERFQRWVCEEVLPALRRDGAYRVVTPGLRGQIETLRIKLQAAELRAQAQVLEARARKRPMIAGMAVERPEGWVSIPEFVQARLPAGDSRIVGAGMRLGHVVQREKPRQNEDVVLARGIASQPRRVFRPGYLDAFWPEVAASYGIAPTPKRKEAA